MDRKIKTKLVLNNCMDSYKDFYKKFPIRDRAYYDRKRHEETGAKYSDSTSTASNLAYVERVLGYGQVTPIINDMIKSGETDPKKIAKEIDNRFKGTMNKMENNLIFIKKITEMIGKHTGKLGPSNTDY